MASPSRQSCSRTYLWLAIFMGLNSIDFFLASPFNSLDAQAAEPKPTQAPNPPSAAPAKQDDEISQQAMRLFKPLPKSTEPPINPDLISLGKTLFYDPRMSADGTVSCSRCHLAALYGTDGLPKSRGAHDLQLPRNAPTVLNSGLNFKQHWRGELQSVEEQATKALLGPVFANRDSATAMNRIKAIPEYGDLFHKAFPDTSEPLTPEHWGQAIGAYERTLVTPSRFDDYLGGKIESLTAAERHGLHTFIDTGCATCHSGVGLGGNKFEKFGLVEDYWPHTGSKEVDKGRYELTKDASDLYVFKVPGLRNVEMTPPYFHDGSVGELPKAVKIMAETQLGATLSEADTSAIVTFLKSLTAPLPKSFGEVPVLPPGAFHP